ncbi:hypothetical protein CJ195_03145 [Bacillus sp. UMB0899]|nr:hypothetical protein CJ195_03145 [Bacillus sp. UMB0899]
MAVYAKVIALDYYFNAIVEWSGRHSTPAGSEEAQLPPRGKRVTGAKWNELILTLTVFNLFNINMY